MNGSKIWASLLFAKTDWTNPKDVDDYIEYSSKLMVPIYYSKKGKSLLEITTKYIYGVLLKSNPEESKSFSNLSNEEALMKYGPDICLPLSEELNSILVQEAFEEIDLSIDENLVRGSFDDYLEDESENDLLVEDKEEEFNNKYLLTLAKLNSKISKIHYTVFPDTTDKGLFKYSFKISTANLENYLYFDFMEYLKENDIPVRCSSCLKVIVNPSKIQLTKARKREHIFHHSCFREHRKEKDRLRKIELRKNK
ncbi:hypothetical protein [Lysinibacillus boronitolerans]|uniref:hypothetical protein n=1 Tax=Lysinibacillus TaxID=400634 RepID=UPI0002D5DF39|nr:hypothetical protein [Lysinibacillus boronitolerans]